MSQFVIPSRFAGTMEKTMEWKKTKVQKTYTVIRVQASGVSADKRKPCFSYLVTLAFHQIIQDLDVVYFTHSYSSNGLSFFLYVEQPKETVRTYLVKLKRWHIASDAWHIYLIDGSNEYEIFSEFTQRGAEPTEQQLRDMAKMHMRMGSRPLRFSKYATYAVLTQLGRTRSYGCVGMSHNGSHEDMSFKTFLIALQSMARSYRTSDFSSVSSFEELRRKGQEMEAELLFTTGGIKVLNGFLFLSTYLAACYEQKIPFAALSQKTMQLSKGLEKDYARDWETPGLRAYREHGVRGVRDVPITGFEELIHHALRRYQQNQDLDDLTLYLMSTTIDTTMLNRSNIAVCEDVQKRAQECLYGNVDRDELDRYFTMEKLTSGGIADLVATTILLHLIEEEELEED